MGSWKGSGVQRRGWWERRLRVLSVETTQAWERLSRETAARGDKQAQAWAGGMQEGTGERHTEEMAGGSKENQERVVPQSKGTESCKDGGSAWSDSEKPTGMRQRSSGFSNMVAVSGLGGQCSGEVRLSAEAGGVG